MRSPVSPKVAVQAGSKHAMTFTTIMMAKQSQKARPISPPTMPVFKVATAILALILIGINSLDSKCLNRSVGRLTHQKVHAFQTFDVFFARSSSVTLSIPPVSTDKVRNHLLKALPSVVDSVSPVWISSFVGVSKECLKSISWSVVRTALEVIGSCGRADEIAPKKGV
jgi:hypothetical protein